MADISFKRLATLNADGSASGELTIGNKTWPTVERGKKNSADDEFYSSVRGPGEYKLIMAKKARGNTEVKCMSFYHPGTSRMLIHDAYNNDAGTLEGCIAPGLQMTNGGGVTSSVEAMEEIWEALGDYSLWRLKTIWIKNNIPGVTGTQAEWLKARALTAK